MPRTLVIRRVPALLAVPVLTLVVAAGCGSELSSTSGSSSGAGASGGQTEDSTAYPTQPKKACDVLTEAVARKLLGNVAPATSPPPKAGSDTVTVSTCVRTNAVSSAGKSSSASLLMRVARTSAGAQSNRAVFTSPPEGSRTVGGYGEKAFWNPAFGQLNILRNGNWYILSIGPIDPRTHTLTATTKLADAIKDQL